MLLEGEREKKEILIRELRDKIYELEQKRRLEDLEETKRNDYMSKITTINENNAISKLNAEI